MKRVARSMSVAAVAALATLPLGAAHVGAAPAAASAGIVAADGMQNRRAGGGANRSRPSHPQASSRPQHRPDNRPAVRNSSRSNINSSRTNINNNNVNVNVNRNNNYNSNHYDHHNHWDDDWDDHWHPVATAATVAVTAAVVGSIVRSVPPSCTTTIINGISYSQCGSTWYQPRYSGTTVEYVVVNPPR